MKNILLGPVFMLLFLPQVSFGANQTTVVPNPAPLVDPALAAFNQKQDAESVAFFNQQGQERGAFIQANQAIIAKQDQIGKWKLTHSSGQGHQGLSAGSSPSWQLTPQEQSTLAAFVAKQQSDKMAFFAKLTKERQDFLNSPSSSPTAN